jgi:hypothetical protein
MVLLKNHFLKKSDQKSQWGFYAKVCKTIIVGICAEGSFAGFF